MKIKQLLMSVIFVLMCISYAGTEDADLVWDANTESDLIGYNVYRSTTAGGQILGPEISPHFLDYVSCWANDVTCAEYYDDDLPYGLTLYWVVTAMDLAGNESGKSNEVNYTTLPEPDTTPPTSPTGCYIRAIIP